MMRLMWLAVCRAGSRAPRHCERPTTRDPPRGLGRGAVVGRDRLAFRHELAGGLTEPSCVGGSGARSEATAWDDPSLPSRPGPTRTAQGSPHEDVGRRPRSLGGAGGGRGEGETMTTTAPGVLE